jgi:hypothetical protein
MKIMSGGMQLVKAEPFIFLTFASGQKKGIVNVMFFLMRS